jgi:hypothetical protein
MLAGDTLLTRFSHSHVAIDLSCRSLGRIDADCGIRSNMDVAVPDILGGCELTESPQMDHMGRHFSSPELPERFAAHLLIERLN